MAEKYYIGIEATSGRTVALLANADGEIVGEGAATSAVYSQVGQERSSQALWTAIITAFGGAGYNTRDMLEAGQTLPPVGGIAIGMSGIERAKDESQVRRIIARYNLTENITVTSDAHIILEAGCINPDDPEQPTFGLAVLGGETGLALAKTHDGKLARAGGGGYLLGDEGSSHFIGLEAVRAALRAADGRGEMTALTGLIEREWKIPADRSDQLQQKIYGLLANLGAGGNKAQYEDTVESFKRALGTLAPGVERLAVNGDAVALEILDRTASALAEAAEAALERAGLQNADAKIPFAIHGAALLTNAGALRNRLRQLLPQCDDPISVMNPAEGALRLAMS
jgi:glucosamine kinase